MVECKLATTERQLYEQYVARPPLVQSWTDNEAAVTQLAQRHAHVL